MVLKVVSVVWKLNLNLKYMQYNNFMTHWLILCVNMYIRMSIASNSYKNYLISKTILAGL